MRRAFTLVELLVVIGIIGVLISIMLPVMARVRQHSVAVQCASNLRQIAIGFRSYADGNRGWCVPLRMPLIKGSRNLYNLGNGLQYRPRWYELTASYSKNYAFREPSVSDDDSREIDNPVFLCPGEPEWKNSRNYAYGYNYQFLGNCREKSKSKYINYPVNFARIRAAETVFAADSMGTAAGHNVQDRTAYQNDGSHVITAYGNHGYIIDPPRLTADSDYAEANHRRPSDRSGPDPRHRKRANVAFCDGHVQLMTLEEIGYVVATGGNVAADSSRASNKLFSGNGSDADPPSIR